MNMLGIDPGCITSGFGVIRREGRRVFLLEYGCLQMSSKKILADRIADFHDFFTEKIATHNISNIAIETPFLGKNAQNFLKLGYLRGIVYLLSSKHGLAVHEFSPCEVKQLVTGYGSASKEQVARALFQFFPVIKKPKKHDVTDALAITLCGVWKKGT